MKYQSNAQWPDGTIPETGNITTDTHDNEASASVVCERLEEYGWGGDGKVFPIRTWVEPIENKGPNLSTNYELKIDMGKMPKPIAWITNESIGRLKQGGNCKGTVPIHCEPNHVSVVGLYTEKQMQEERDRCFKAGTENEQTKADARRYQWIRNKITTAKGVIEAQAVLWNSSNSRRKLDKTINKRIK